MLARAASLGPAARRLLEVVAAVPARAELWLLEAVAGDDLEALGSCLGAGMLHEDGDAVAFRHELARLAIESGVAPHRRRAAEPGDPGCTRLPARGRARRRAARPSRGGRGRRARRVLHSKAAGERAGPWAPTGRRPRSSGGRSGTAMDLAPAEHAALLAACAQEAQLTGRYTESIAARAEAISLYRELGDRRAEGDNLSRSSMPFVSVGRNAEAEHASRAAIELLEALPPGRELAAAYAYQAYMRMLNRDNAEGIEWGEKALALAVRFDDVETTAMALNLIGTSYVMAGEIDRGCGYLDRSLDVSRRHGFEARVASAFVMLGSGLGEMYELERAEHWLREHIAFAEEHDLDASYTQSWLAAVAVYRGRWDEGAGRARDVLARAVGAISPMTALIALGRVRARRGDPGALDVLDEALQMALPGGHLQRLGHVRAARAEAAWLAGDRERTLEEARAAYGLALEKRHLWFAGELAYWQWKAGSLEGVPDWIAEPYRLQLGGDAHGAAEAWRARGCPYEAARALAEAEDDEALLAALDVFEGLGAGPAAKLLRQALRERGLTLPRGPRPATQANPAKLTAREVEVLRLVAAGMRNAEVARELVLSPRTVDHHVSAILRKLDVRSRGEAAVAASRIGLLGDR